jgi:hypothetical protein
MSDRDSLADDDLEPGISARERALLAEVAARLVHERPAPRAGFRAQLRAELRGLVEHGPMRSRPAWLWRRVAILSVSGTGLLGLVGLGLAGTGPFGP